MSEYYDPRQDIDHPINIGQVYEDDRTDDLTKVVYLDEDCAVLRDKEGDHHRFERRETFDEYVGAGRYKLRPDEEFGYAGRVEAIRDALERLKEEDGRKAKHKAEALSEALSLLTEETPKFVIIPFEDVDGIGSRTAERLRHAGYKTVEDIRRTGDADLLSVNGMGEQNLDALREYVDNV